MSRPAIAGLILCAGASRRMGFPKALLTLQGQTFADRLFERFAETCSPVIAALGHDAGLIRAGLQCSASAVFALNPDPDRGMLSSLQCALQAAPPETEAVIFTPVDYPNIQSATIAALAHDFQTYRAPVTQPAYRGKRGHPVCVSRAVAAEICALPVTAQARDVIRAHRCVARSVSVDDPGILTDVDQPNEYRELLAGSRA